MSKTLPMKRDMKYWEILKTRQEHLHPQQKKKTNNIYSYIADMPRKQIIKFILATGIFYACLAFNVFHIGEKIVPTSTDYVDTDISQTDQDIEDIYLQEDTPIQEQIGHSAASYTNNLDSLCETTLLCDKINYNGIFSNTEKYSYTKVIDKIVQFIDKNSKIKKQIQDTIKTITINKENGNRR